MTSGSPLLTALRRRLRAMTGAVRERGASALEFAIIAAVVVVASSVIGAVVYNIVVEKGDQLTECANQPVGGECAGGGGAPAGG